MIKSDCFNLIFTKLISKNPLLPGTYKKQKYYGYISFYNSTRTALVVWTGEETFNLEYILSLLYFYNYNNDTKMAMNK